MLEVVGQLAVAGLEVVGVDLLQGLADPVVQGGPAGPGQPPVQGVADEHVGEPVAVADVHGRGDEVEGDDLVEQLQQVRALDLGQLGEHVDGELLADDRRLVQHLPGPGGDEGEPPLHRLLHPLGDELVEAALELGRVQALGQGQDQLLEEQRVAAGPLAEPGREGLRDLQAGGQGDIAGDLGLVEALEGQPDGGRLPGQLGQGPHEVLALVSPGVAVGGHHQQPGVGQLPGEEPEQQQRRVVGAVQVVQDQHPAGGR